MATYRVQRQFSGVSQKEFGILTKFAGKLEGMSRKIAKKANRIKTGTGKSELQEARAARANLQKEREIQGAIENTEKKSAEKISELQSERDKAQHLADTYGKKYNEQLNKHSEDIAKFGQEKKNLTDQVSGLSEQVSRTESRLGEATKSKNRWRNTAIGTGIAGVGVAGAGGYTMLKKNN